MYNIIILLKKKNYKKYHKALDNIKVIMYNNNYSFEKENL